MKEGAQLAQRAPPFFRSFSCNGKTDSSERSESESRRDVEGNHGFPSGSGVATFFMEISKAVEHLYLRFHKVCQNIVTNKS